MMRFIVGIMFVFTVVLLAKGTVYSEVKATGSASLTDRSDMNAYNTARRIALERAKIKASEMSATVVYSVFKSRHHTTKGSFGKSELSALSAAVIKSDVINESYKKQRLYVTIKARVESKDAEAFFAMRDEQMKRLVSLQIQNQNMLKKLKTLEQRIRGIAQHDNRDIAFYDEVQANYLKQLDLLNTIDRNSGEMVITFKRGTLKKKLSESQQRAVVIKESWQQLVDRLHYDSSMRVSNIVVHESDKKRGYYTVEFDFTFRVKDRNAYNQLVDKIFKRAHNHLIFHSTEGYTLWSRGDGLLSDEFYDYCIDNAVVVTLRLDNKRYVSNTILGPQRVGSKCFTRLNFSKRMKIKYVTSSTVNNASQFNFSVESIPTELYYDKYIKKDKGFEPIH